MHDEQTFDKAGSVASIDPAPEMLPQVTDPNDPPWGSLAAFLFWVMSVVAIIVFPAMITFPYLFSALADPQDSLAAIEFAKTDPTAILLQIIGIAPAHLVTLIAGWFLVTGGGRRPFFETLGWRSGGIRWWHYLIIMGSFFVVAAIVQTVLPEQEHELIRMLRSSRNAAIALAILAAFSAPLVEEVIYRGVMFSAFQKKFGLPVAFTLVTLMFSIVHVPQYLESPATILMLTLLSITLTYLRVYSGNLLPAFILHTVFNGVQSILLLAEPYIQRLAETTTPIQ